MSMTVPPGGSGPLQGRSPLDGPPPLPGNVNPQAVAQQGGYSGLGNGELADPNQGLMKGLVTAFQTVDQILLAAANSLPESSQEFGAARKLIEQGLAKGLAAKGQTSEAGPTNAGSQFPGGGFGSVGGGLGT